MANGDVYGLLMAFWHKLQIKLVCLPLFQGFIFSSFICCSLSINGNGNKLRRNKYLPVSCFEVQIDPEPSTILFVLLYALILLAYSGVIRNIEFYFARTWQKVNMFEDSSLTVVFRDVGIILLPVNCVNDFDLFLECRISGKCIRVGTHVSVQNTYKILLRQLILNMEAKLLYI